MNKQLRKGLVLMGLGLAFASCDNEVKTVEDPKDPNNGKQVVTPEDKRLDNLKDVNFDDIKNQPDEVVETKATDEVVTDPTTGTNKYEVLTKIKKSYRVKPLAIVEKTFTDHTFPGVMLKGDSFLAGKLDPVVLEKGFNDITLSTTFKGKVVISKDVEPGKVSDFRNFTNDLIAKQDGKIDFDYVPAKLQYDSSLVMDESSLKKSLGIHFDVDVEALKGIVKVNGQLGYDWTKTDKSAKKNIVVSFRQILYSVSVDTKHWTKWFEGEVKAEDFGEYEPVYISTIDYGRAGYVVIQTDEKTEEIAHKFKLGVEAAGNIEGVTVGGGLGLEYNQKLEKLFKDKKVKVVIFGGSTDLVVDINDYASFRKYMRMSDTKELVKSAAPISYKVRRLRDNTEVEVYDRFTDFVYEMKDKK